MNQREASESLSSVWSQLQSMSEKEQGNPDTAVDRVLAEYERSPLLRMIVAAYPPAAVVEAGILATYKWWRERRLYVFADELTLLHLNPTEDEVKTRQFAEAFGATARRVLDTEREEKIRLFAKLFASYVSHGEYSSATFDEFDEELSIVEEISYREFRLLLILHKYEVQRPLMANENQVMRTAESWPAFRVEAASELDISEDVLDAMLQRLVRTGLYQIITGTYFDYHGNRGYLTPLFDGLLGKLHLTE